MRCHQTVFIIFLFATMIISCRKQAPDTVASPVTQTPAPGVLRAVAGNDTLIYFSNNADFTLDGSKSVFPASGPREYAWTQVSGPSLLNFSSLGNSKVFLKFMSYGTYVFELTVNNVTAQARDSITVKVESGWCNPTLEYRQAVFQEIYQLGEPIPGNASVCSANGQLIFSGGSLENAQRSLVAQDKIYIFNSATSQWNTARMSSPRYQTGVAANDRVAVIVGGTNGTVWSNTIDIYDFSTGILTSSVIKGTTRAINVTLAQNKAYVFGGFDNNDSVPKQLQILDIGSGAWSTASFPEARMSMLATVMENKICFTGGLTPTYDASKDISIFDINNARWSKLQMRYGRFEHTGVVIDQKLFLLGGFDLSTWDYVPISDMEVVDLATSTVEKECLRPRSTDLEFAEVLTSATVGKNLYYLNDNLLTRYDISSGTSLVSKLDGIDLAGIFSNGTSLMGFSVRTAPGVTTGYLLKIYRIVL